MTPPVNLLLASSWENVFLQWRTISQSFSDVTFTGIMALFFFFFLSICWNPLHILLFSATLCIFHNVIVFQVMKQVGGETVYLHCLHFWLFLFKVVFTQARMCLNVRQGILFRYKLLELRSICWFSVVFEVVCDFALGKSRGGLKVRHWTQHSTYVHIILFFIRGQFMNVHSVKRINWNEQNISVSGSKCQFWWIFG